MRSAAMRDPKRLPPASFSSQAPRLPLSPVRSLRSMVDTEPDAMAMAARGAAFRLLSKELLAPKPLGEEIDERPHGGRQATLRREHDMHDAVLLMPLGKNTDQFP